MRSLKDWKPWEGDGWKMIDPDPLHWVHPDGMTWQYTPPRGAIQKPRRVRKTSLPEAEKQARRIGRSVASFTDAPGGVRTFALNEPGAAKEATPEEPPSRSVFKTRTIPKMKVVL